MTDSILHSTPGGSAASAPHGVAPGAPIPPDDAASLEARGGWIDLADRARIRATGKDRSRFLNGMLTNDIARLTAGTCLPVLLLDRKGHVLSEGLALAHGDEILLSMAPDTGAAVLEVLERHLIADDVRLEDVSEPLSELSIEGEAGRRWLAGRGLPVPEPGKLSAGPGGLVLAGDGWLTRDGVRMLGPRGALLALVEGALPRLEGERLERLRIEHLVPLCGRDIAARTFPQEARLDRAVSYTKGCYLGQEIVARIHSRGAVNRFLVQLECEAQAQAGSPVTSRGSNVGALTSVAARPAGGVIALGYVKKDHAAPGTELEVGGAAARVIGPAL